MDNNWRIEPCRPGTGYGDAFAWQPEPEPPPLPEPLPTADEVYGILSPAHPASGGPGFNEDGAGSSGATR